MFIASPDCSGSTRNGVHCQTTAPQAGVDVVTARVADNALSASLREGPFDGSAALWRSAEREGYLLYSEAYLENGNADYTLIDRMVIHHLVEHHRAIPEVSGRSESEVVLLRFKF